MLKKRATIIVSWEKWPKKEGAYPKSETHGDRPQKSAMDYKVYSWTTKNHKKWDIDYKRLQKSDIDYKVYW